MSVVWYSRVIVKISNRGIGLLLLLYYTAGSLIVRYRKPLLNYPFMKKNKTYGLIFLSLTLILPSTIKAANTSSGLTNDFYIKLQEEKSALEYRISSLETSSYNSPDLSSLNIQSRIDGLIRERETEKNYITGLYGKNGIGNQLPAALAGIDTKYQSQIDNLNQQKAYYQNQISSQQSSNNELSQTKLRIQELDKLLAEQDKLIQSLKTQVYTAPPTVNKIPTATEIFTYLDSSNINWITAGNQFETLKTTNFSLYYEVLMIAETKYFKGYTPETLFLYMDSLSQKEVSAYLTKLRIFNPNLLELSYRIARVKYPNGKFNEDGTLNTTTPKPSVTPTTAPILKPSPKVEKKVVTVPTSNTTATSVQATSEIKQDAPTDSTTQQVTEVKPEKKSFIQKTSDFFKKIIFWR